MSLIVTEGLTRVYQSQDIEHYALKNVSLSFPSKGLIGIIGKSGSGKSTLLNLLALLDKPTSGCIYYQGENVFRWKEKKKKAFLSNEVGMIFQHYNLLENETVLYNIMLPALIKGTKEKVAKEKAIELLKEIDFKKDLYQQKCSNLSGGEKQRVALLRAVINSPKIVFADEPTGALDSINSFLVMNLLKKISEERLVIVVSHNNTLINEYADRIITIKDGRVSEDKIINKIEETSKPIIRPKQRTNNKWINHLAFTNIKKHRKRNFFSIASLTIGLTASFLIFGFSSHSTIAIKEESFKQLDYGNITITKENKTDSLNNGLSIVRNSRPSQEEMEKISQELTDYEIELNLDVLFPSSIPIKYENNEEKGFTFESIYSYLDSYIDPNLIIGGRLPARDTFEEVIINQNGYDYLKKQYNVEPLYNSFSFKYEYQSTYYSDEVKDGITDYFILEKTCKIVGICKEISFLATPKMYYSYLAFKEYLSSIYLNNLSTYFNRDYSWIDRIDECNESEEISSYSFKLFHKDYQQFSQIEEDIKKIGEPFAVTSTGKIRTDALLGLVSAASVGMELFMVIALVGTALIMGIVSFSFYSEDKKKIAILHCLGSDIDSVNDIYSLENMLIGLLAFIGAIIISPLLQFVINLLIKKWFGFSNIIAIPILKLYDIPLGLPVLVLACTILLAILSTSLPIYFSKKISIKEELKDE